MFGQAKGVRDNYGKNPNIYAQNAEYGEESKQQSTDARIKTLGGIGNAVALDVTDASIKAVQQDSGIKAYKTAGFVDDGGHVTGKGRNAFAISPTEMANQLGVKEDVLFGDDAGKNMVEQLKQVARKAGKSEDDINKALHSYNLTDENGKNPASGLDLVAGLAKMGAMNYSASKALSFMGMTMSANIDGDANAKIVRADGGNAVNMANSLEVGDSTKINTEGKFKSQTSAFQLLHGGREPKNLQELAKWVETSELAESSKNDFFGNLVNTIATYAGTEDKTELMAVAAGMGFGGYALNKAMGNPIGKGAGKIADGITSATNKLRGISDETSSNTKNSSPDDSNDKHNNKPSNSHSEETTHNKSFNSDKDSMPNNSESVKSESGFSQGKTTSSGIHVPDGFDLSEPHTAKPKSWLGQRVDAVKNAMNGGGSWKTKLGLATSAALLGSASETFANMLELADPMSHLMGTSTSTDADLKLGQTSAKNLSGVTPAHLQGFSTQPFGYHTSNAMMQEQAAQAQVSTAGNIATLTALTEARSGGFTLQGSSGENVSFTTSKEAGHHIMMNNQDMGMPYQQFSSMMQNQEMAAQFSNALAGSDLSNKDSYDFMNKTLLDMDMKTEQANRRQRMFDNATATNQRLDHKETIQALKQKSKDEFEG